MARYLFGEAEGLIFFGGHEAAERKMLIFLPEYLDKSFLQDDGSPIVCLRASFYNKDSLSHRDFLGALIGAGITRQSIGDICVDAGSCDFFVTAEIAPFLLQNFDQAGRVKLKLTQIPLCDAHIPQPETEEIRDTLSSLRLDSVVSAGFRISRAAAAQYIAAGKVAMDGIICEKPDKAVIQGTKISLRSMGKIQLAEVGGQSKKDRTFVIINRYI